MANWYVRPDGYASGTNAGTSWTNAWKGFTSVNWASLAAGDTLWVAGSTVDGNYTTQCAPAQSGTNGNQLLIYRVTASDAVPVAAAGWNASFDSQVVFNVAAGNGLAWASGVNNRGSYITVDGRTTSGILVNSPDTDFGAGIYMTTGMAGVVIRYVESSGPSNNPTPPYTYLTDCSALQINNGGGGTITNPTFQYCSFHGSVNLAKIGYVAGITIEHCKFYDNIANSVGGTFPFHVNVVTAYLNTGTCIFRYNEVYNWGVEGIMCWSAGASQTWEIYGNLFHDCNTFYGTVARLIEVQDTSHTIKLYQNTLVNASVLYRTANSGTFGASSQARNNIAYGLNSVSDTGGLTDTDYNFTNLGSVTGASSIANGSNPFLNYAGRVYGILATIAATYPRNKGQTLAGTYGTDFSGNAFASPPSMGAYEYGGTAGFPVRPLGASLGGFF